MARILVIDDDVYVREMLREMLTDMGHTVEEASEGMQGINAYDREPADIVITDILMPKKEGIQTIMDLRREYPDAKIIAMSGGGAVGPDTYLTIARELGADRTLTKPFPMAKLAELVNELI